jgi:hypothetical protein
MLATSTIRANTNQVSFQKPDFSSPRNELNTNKEQAISAPQSENFVLKVLKEEMFKSDYFPAIFFNLLEFSPLSGLGTFIATFLGLAAKNKISEKGFTADGARMILQDLHDTILDVPNTGEYRDGGPFSNKNSDGSPKTSSTPS